jgi:endothelin-converting enzyme
MDKSVIKLAIEKVHKIVQKIGYPTKVNKAVPF